MVHGKAEVDLGYDTVFMMPCHNDDDGIYGLVFRSREPGEVTEKEYEEVGKAVNSGDIDVILTFKTPESFDKLINILQALRDDMAKREG